MVLKALPRATSVRWVTTECWFVEKAAKLGPRASSANLATWRLRPMDEKPNGAITTKIKAPAEFLQSKDCLYGVSKACLPIPEGRYACNHSGIFDLCAPSAAVQYRQMVAQSGQRKTKLSSQMEHSPPFLDIWSSLGTEPCRSKFGIAPRPFSRVDAFCAVNQTKQRAFTDTWTNWRRQCFVAYCGTRCTPSALPPRVKNAKGC